MLLIPAKEGHAENVTEITFLLCRGARWRTRGPFLTERERRSRGAVSLQRAVQPYGMEISFFSQEAVCSLLWFFPTTF